MMTCHDIPTHDFWTILSLNRVMNYILIGKKYGHKKHFYDIN